MISMNSNHDEDDGDKQNQCVLCFNEYKVHDTTSSDLSKLYKLCCKYLHSALTKENTENRVNECKKEKTLPFCPECFRSAVQLSELREKINVFQKSFSDLILMFTFGIIHRREKTNISEENTENNNRDDHLKLNVSLFPECESWVLPHTTDYNPSSSCFAQSKENQHVTGDTGENIFQDDELEYAIVPGIPTSDLVQMDNVNDVNVDSCKIEILPNEEMDFIMGGTFEKTAENINDNIMKIFSSNTRFSDPKLHSTSRTRKVEGDCMKTPVIILEQLQFKSNGNIVSKHTNENNNNSGPGPSQNAGPSQMIMKSILNITENCPSSSQVLESMSTEASYLPSEMSSPPLACADLIFSPDLQFSLNKPVTDTIRKESSKTFNLPSSNASVKCPSCGKMYANRESLKNHVRFYHGNGKIRPVKCTVCGKEFLRNQDFKRHMRIHTGIKPFKCSFCNRRFTVKCSLTEHVRTHTGERVPCPVCKQKFSCRTALSSHIKKHNIEKPYKCELCEYSCKYPSLLKTHTHHVHNHNLKSNFKCKECDEHFKTVESAVQHYKHVHFALDFSDDCIIQLTETDRC